MIRVFIIDDHPLAVTGLSNMLLPFPQVRVTGTFNEGRALLEALRHTAPDVLLLDLMLRDYNGKDLAEEILRLHPGIRIIVITSLDTPTLVKSMMRAGCLGYLLKDTSTSDLVKAIETVYAGKEYIDSSIKERMFDNLHRFRKKKEEPAAGIQQVRLTRREKEVLALMAAEKTNQEIAETLCLSIRTIENHRLNLLRKLDVKTPIGILKSAIEMGLL